jgi:hypothetical protein
VLPVGAATVHADRIETSPFELQSSVEAEYYRHRGRTLLDDRGRHGRV